MVDQPLAEAAEEEFAEAAEPPATDDQEVACHLPDVGQQVVGFKDLAASSATLRGTAGPNRPSTGSPEAIAVTLVIVPPQNVHGVPGPRLGPLAPFPWRDGKQRVAGAALGRPCCRCDG